MAFFIARGGTTINNIYYSYISISYDGINWSAPTQTNALANLGRIRTGQGLFLAQNQTANPNGGVDTLAVSADGINWSYRYYTFTPGGPVTQKITGPIIYGNDTFVDIDFYSSGGDNLSLTSPDAYNWTNLGGANISSLTESLNGFGDYGNGVYVLGTSYTSYGEPTLHVSTNGGDTFVEKSILGAPTGTTSSHGIFTIGYTGSAWVGLKTVGSGVYDFQSTDNGGTWTSPGTQFGSWLTNQASCTSPENVVYAIGRTATGPSIAVNAGSGWVISALPNFHTGVNGSTNYADITAFGSTIVIVGSYRDAGSSINNGLIITSNDNGATWTRTDGGAWGALPVNNAGNNAPIYDAGAYSVGVTPIEQTTDISATLRYNAPASTGYDSLTLYRVAKDFRFGGTGQAFPIPPRSEDGRPYYENAYDPSNPTVIFTTEPGQLPYHEEVVEEWGKIAVLINNQDVTFYRDTATIVENVAWQSFGNFETASLFLPSVTVFDNLGVARPTLTSGTGGGLLPTALPWLYDSAPVEIKRLLPDGTQQTIWLGSINNFEIDGSGVGVRISAHGLIYDANHQVLPGPYRENTAARQTPQDVGLLTADVLNSIEGRWSYAEPVAIGIDTIKVPNWDNALDFLRNLSSLGVPELWVDENGKPYVTGRPNGSRPASTIDIIAGQEGVQLELSQDGTAPATVIYGSGSLPGGTTWRNVVYAYPSPSNPSYEALRWPFDDPNTLMIVGMKNSDTVTNYGITSLSNRLMALGRLTRTYTVYNRTIENVIRDLQNDWGYDETGKVNAALWSRLIGVADVTQGARIEPIYISPLVDPASPSYDPTVRRVEQYIDFGDDITVDEAKVVAEQIAMRDMIRYNTGTPAIYKQNKSITGNINLTLCPIGYSNPATTNVARWDIKPGDTIRIWGHLFAPIPSDTHTYPTGTTWEGGDSAGSVLVYVKRVEWNLSGAPTVNLSVSSRNLEYSELDAAQERVRVSNAEQALAKKVKKKRSKK